MLAALLAAAILVVWPGSAPHRLAPGVPSFVASALGTPRASLPSVSQPNHETSSTVTPSGLQVRLGPASVSLSSDYGTGRRWTPYSGGAVRPTRFGHELVIVNRSGAEQLLQVDAHQGLRTWRWRLHASGLAPSLRADGSVAFLAARGRDSGLRIAPVQLLDTQGRSVTPRGLRWSLARRGGADYLQLRLDDSKLPVPYLIDPQVGTVTFSAVSTVAGATTNWTVGFTQTSGGGLNGTSTITVKFSSAAPYQNFTVPAAPTIVLNSGFSSCTAGGVGVPATATVTINLSGASCSLPASAAAQLTINGIKNPTQAGSYSAPNFSVNTNAAGDSAQSPSGPVTITPGTPVALLLVLPGMAQQPGSLLSSCGYTSCPVSPSATDAGTLFSATVAAVDQYSNTVTTVTDTVDLSSTDPIASLPADFPLVAGTKTFNLTLKTAGSVDVTASDVTDGSKTASTVPGVPVNALAPSQLLVWGPSSATAGADFDVTVYPIDPYGNFSPVVADTTISLSASGSGTLTNGTGVISPSDLTTFGYWVDLPNVEYTKAETITLTAHATAGPPLADSAPSDPITIDPAPATKLVASAPGSAIANAPLSVDVSAEDQFDNVDTNYTGTVSLTSSDGAATLPGPHAFTGGDAGTYSFPVTLKTLGSQTVSAHDGTFNATSGPISVGVGSASTFSLTGTPASVTAGGTGSVTVTARDSYGNVVTGFTGTVHFTSTDGAALLPADYAFTGGDAGVHTFSNLYTLETAGSQTLTAASGAVTGTSAAITVNPGPAATLTASAAGAVALSTPLNVTVTAKDAYGNVATGYTGNVGLSSTDGAATLPGNHTFTAGDAGVHVFSVTFGTSGTQTVTASDGSLSGTTGPIGVGAGPASGATSTISAAPGTITADGTSTSTITVQLKDAFGTSLSAGGDTVLLSTTGGTLTPVTDNGNGTYKATLTSASSPGSGTVSGTVNGTPITATATVTFAAAGPGPASGATSTIGASPGSIQADGVSTSTITVQLKDAVGTNLTAGGDTVTLSTTNGTLTPVTDNLNGTYSATLTSPTSAGSATVSGTVNGTPIVSTASVTFTAGPPPPPPPAGPAPLVCGPGLHLSSNGKWCVGPPPPPVVFLGSSPADGAVVTALDTITLNANHMTTWYAISVTGPDGATTTIAPGFGASYSQPFSPTATGAYTLTATMDDGWNPVQHITAHFTVVPYAPNLALPGKAGYLLSSDGDTSVSWTATTFADAVHVNLEDDPSVGSFGIGSRIARVTVTKLSDGTELDTFAQPLELVFAPGPAGVPSFSQDGVSWVPLPALTSDVLPADQADGYFVDSTGAVHVLTRHLTYFGVLTPKLALTVSGSVDRLRNGAQRISMTVRLNRAARLVATLYSPSGDAVQTWRRTVPAGTSTLRLFVPAAKVQPGMGTIVLRATSGGEVAQSTFPITLR